MVKRAKGEHRPRMALASRFLKQREGSVMVGWSATAVNEHLAKKNLRVHNPCVGGARQPGTAFDSICGDAAAFDQHAPIPVLGSRDALCRPAKPQRSLGVITLDPDAFGETDGEVEGGNEVPCLGGALEPMTRLGLILRLAAAAEHEVRKVGFGRLVAEVGCTLQPEILRRSGSRPTPVPME